MKIIHTSDWHIGQRLYYKDREREHKLFFDWLVELINEREIETLIVSGDIFDIAYPSNLALEFYFKTLFKLSKTYCKNIIITGGNHDSISTLNAPKEILKYLNVFVVGGASKNIEDEIIEISNNGKLELVVAAVPFLRDKDIRKPKAAEDAKMRSKAVREGIKLHYENIWQETKKYKAQNIPIIATGHLFVKGAKVSDSERNIYIGNLEGFSNNIFPEGFDYIALGHIHRPQKVSDKIRYSGSPIPLSFSERKDIKSVVIYDTEIRQLETIEIPVFRKLLSIKGTLKEVKEKLKEYKSTSVLSVNEEKDWADVHIEEDDEVPVINDLFQEFLENNTLDIEIINHRISFKKSFVRTEEIFHENNTLKDLSPEEVFEKLLDKSSNEEKEELMETFSELLVEINSIDD